jgi:hypothetical protein
MLRHSGQAKREPESSSVFDAMPLWIPAPAYGKLKLEL